MLDLFAVKFAYLIPLLPLLAAIGIGFFGAKTLREFSHVPVWISVGISALLAFALLFGMLSVGADPKTGYIFATKTLYTWISSGTFTVSMGFLLDPLTAVMLCVVCGIGFWITIFSQGYMEGEDGYFRFFAFVALFIFAMTMLVMGDNLVLLYLGWEGVGLCSYLLIGYYYKTDEAKAASQKAFIVNRIGDAGFAVGIMLIFAAFGTVSFYGDGPGTFTGFLEMATKGSLTDYQKIAIQVAPFLLMIGAFGKSAQFPLYTWLPDAMAGPTPVSALIHAATMVTAGVYMIVRCAPLFYQNEAAMLVIGIVGCFTAIFAGIIALRQYDLKRVFAYSTVSQLGFMFVGVAMLAPIAGVFHLVTHAFFKALLFLSCGVVMHAMAGSLDLREMSGLKRVLPKTRILLLIGALALAGFPLTSGFFSKDEILANAWHHNKIIGSIMFFTAIMTAYYTFRLYFRVFEGPLKQPAGVGEHHGHKTIGAAGSAADSHGVGARGAADDVEHKSHHHNHEPAVMIIPLVVLAIGALFAGWLNFSHGKHSLGGFLGQSPSLALGYAEAAKTYGAGTILPETFGLPETAATIDKDFRESEHTLHYYVAIISGLLAVLGIGLAYYFHLAKRDVITKISEAFSFPIRIIENKFYVDEIYDFAIVRPLKFAGEVCKWVDVKVVDGAIGLITLLPQVSGFTLSKTTQRGFLQSYAMGMLIGIAAILWIVFA